jgi:hypothetical protein
VVLYSSNNPEAIANASSALKKKAPKVSVQSVTGGTGTLMKRIQAEAANPGADLFWSGGFGTLGTAAPIRLKFAAIPGPFGLGGMGGKGGFGKGGGMPGRPGIGRAKLHTHHTGETVM